MALPILILWGFAGVITAWLNNSPQQTKPQLTTEENTFLRQLALRTWRYFYQFGGESHNYLIPDNVEEEGLFEAARVSPTNFGLLLNARQAANTFGYLTIPEFITLTERSLADLRQAGEISRATSSTGTTRGRLKPIRPMTISSVDSGNLAASFYTLRTGCRSMLREPLLDPRPVRRDSRSLAIADESARRTGRPEGAGAAGGGRGCRCMDRLGAGHGRRTGICLGSIGRQQARQHGGWRKPISASVRLVTLVRDYMPWLLPHFAPLLALPQLQGLARDRHRVQTGGRQRAGGRSGCPSRQGRYQPGLRCTRGLLAEELRRAHRARRGNV